MRITVISDSHNKHRRLSEFLPGGDLLIHAGDFSSVGHPHEVHNFCDWFDTRDNYKGKIFIAGNHDLIFENHADKAAEIVNQYEWINYLQDTYVTIDHEGYEVKVYGSPWQPEFMNWAFNLPRNGPELWKVWSDIPDDSDIVVTHGPPYGLLDKVIGRTDLLGCPKLLERFATLRPKLHIFGHIHSGSGYVFNEGTHHINASVLNERYEVAYLPRTFDWDPETNELTFIKIEGKI